VITGVIATSNKENERRVPIHPAHLGRIPAAYRARLRFERGYGKPFGMDDETLADRCGGLLDRDAIFRECRIVLLPKPLAADLRALPEGAILWGWPHCVQQAELTQIAIERKLTLIAWEAMFRWSKAGAKGVHVFYKNNEMAGYCGVLHALELLGLDGHYGRRRSAVVLSFGSVSRGAIYALEGRGFRDVTVFTARPAHLVAHQMFGCRHLQMRGGRKQPGRPLEAIDADGRAVPMIDVLASADLIVNGTLQDTDNPRMFVREDEIARLEPGCLIVDVSCDAGMGFPFARPTSFAAPTFPVGALTYYAVDHTPSYLWDAASWEISEAVVPYLETVMDGAEAWAHAYGAGGPTACLDDSECTSPQLCRESVCRSVGSVSAGSRFAQSIGSWACMVKIRSATSGVDLDRMLTAQRVMWALSGSGVHRSANHAR